MSITLRNLRRSLIVLATIFGASLAAGDASACSTMARGDRACDTVCGCCTPKTNGALGTETDVESARSTAMAPAVPAGCETSPGGACSCRSQEPVAPTPKPSQTTAEGRTELSSGLACVYFGDDSTTRIKLALQVPATQNPPKTPLYLRNERLLF
ncbi:hypothetical protein [Singulisphaera acidiphila]|uniref:Secreted protein n=1 Tax=Singulisphaera acidiphila (strain ATCC BAA-1392 / DSM 18658 / VKM B-2454 / MOB10) TaxID=886293 RepID=L0DGG9_SINAD|nr:hypothetical protein [Singulisphaera acidiphila]AGA27776.1 hypothetical protein Sinac_3520 [Singulisphaera acidiphila DSM 18658]